MIRFYLDSNIYRYIKPSHPSFNKELLKLMDELKEKVLFIFSEAHLHDLSTSQKVYRDEDIKLMEGYVKDNYFRKDPIENKVKCELLTPFQADSQIDHNSYLQSISNPFDFEELFKGLDESDDGKLALDLINSIFNRPLRELGATFDTSRLNESNRKLFDRAFPKYSVEMTLKEFMTSIGPFVSSIMNDSSEVTELRKYISDYMNSEEYSFQKWGMDFNEKIKKVLGKSFLDVIEGIIGSEQKDNFYSRFYYAYTLLEMFNITSERVGGKTKKFNLRSLSNDAAHAYFGSMCDYLVTDDKGLQVKGSILYELFGISTLILSSKDFVSGKEKFLNSQETLNEFLSALKLNLQNSMVSSIYSIIEDKSLVREYPKIERPLFNIFTEMYVRSFITDLTEIILTFPRLWNHIVLMYREIELVVDRCICIFGIDDEKIGRFKFDESLEKGGPIRSWSNKAFQLTVLNTSNGFQINLHVIF